MTRVLLRSDDGYLSVGSDRTLSLAQRCGDEGVWLRQSPTEFSSAAGAPGLSRLAGHETSTGALSFAAFNSDVEFVVEPAPSELPSF